MKQVKREFTLIELLIVISTIALLLAMQVGNFGRAKEAAKFVRWYSFNKQYNYDPSCVLNFNFQERKGVNELTNSAVGCNFPGFNATKYKGVLFGDFEWCEGRFGVKKRALRFNGINTFVEILSSKALDFTEKDGFTILMWVKFEGFTRWDGLFSKSYWASNGHDSQYDLYYNGVTTGAYEGPSMFESGVFQESQTYNGLTVDGREITLNNTKWMNITMRYRSVPGEEVGNVDIFVNGEQLAQEESKGNSGNNGNYNNKRNCDANLIIGAIRWQANASETGATSGDGYKYGHNHIKNNFCGVMDEFLLFNRAFSDKEIKNFYNEGRP